MRVLICNERLLARFGVDRLLLMLARGLILAGHEVGLAALRLERNAVNAITPHHLVAEIRDFNGIETAEDAAAAWLEANWDGLCGGASPDVVVSGGWPFFCAAAVAARFGARSVFIDAGAVPQDGMSGLGLDMQRDLRRVRALTLPCFTAVLPISRFIRHSQTIPDRGHTGGVHTVLLGADHLNAPLFELPPDGQAEDALQRRLDALAAAGAQFLFALGRFEGTSYKDSAAAFTVLRRVRRLVPNAMLLALEREGVLPVPPDLTDAVIPLGFISDGMLVACMRRAVVGIGTSRWEGFNLPLAEMQWEGRLALVLPVGAHAEVVANPWALCADAEEMADKAIALLLGIAPAEVVDPAELRAWGERFRWHDVIARYVTEIDALGAAGAGRGAMLVDADLGSTTGIAVRWQAGLSGYTPGAADAVTPVADAFSRALGGTPTAVLVLPSAADDATGRVLWARANGCTVVAVGDGTAALLADSSAPDLSSALAMLGR